MDDSAATRHTYPAEGFNSINSVFSKIRSKNLLE